MIELSKRVIVDVSENEIYEAVRSLAERFASYDGDPIDDIQEFHHKEEGKDFRLIYVMTPVHEHLFFIVKKDDINPGKYCVEFIGSTWGGLESMLP